MRQKKHAHMVLVVIILIGAFLVIRSAIVGQIRNSIRDNDLEEDVLIAKANCIPPTVSNISIENLTANSATVTWITNQNATSQVKFGSSSNSMNWQTAINSPAFSSGVIAHSYQLKNLLPSHAYYYRVRSSNGFCQKTSSTYSFASLNGNSINGINTTSQKIPID